MLDLMIVGVLLLLIGFGLRYPAVAYAGYMWTDLLRPQEISYGFAATLPFSLIMAGVCVVSMIFHRDKLSRPTSPAIFWLLLCFILWFNLTTFWASHPEQAAFKQDWATKSLGVTLMAFVVINTRASLELFLITFVACVSYYALQTGIKTIVTGGGYGAQLIHGGGNNGLAESSTLGGVAVACMPIMLYLSRWSILIGRSRFRRFVILAGVFVFAIAVIGTHSRTGLVCLLMMGACSIVFAKRRILIVLLVLGTGFSVYQFANTEWVERMSTIKESDRDKSAFGRVVVWRWTLDYVQSRPFGGGFDAYLDNAGVLNAYAPEGMEIPLAAKAFHSVYFEILGEQGFPGLILYLSILLITLRLLMRARSSVSDKAIAADTEPWVRPAATALLLAFLCLILTGAFVGIGYRPYLIMPAVAAGFLVRYRARELTHDLGQRDRTSGESWRASMEVGPASYSRQGLKR